MSENIEEDRELLWENTPIGWPPIRREIKLHRPEIVRGLLNFRFDMRKGWGTKLDIERPIKINDKNVAIPDLPKKQDSKDLEFVERSDIDIGHLLRTGIKGEVNTIEVNYIVSAFAHLKLAAPGTTIGTLSAEVVIQYKSKGGGDSKPSMKFCMWCGQSIPFASIVCPFDGKAPPAGDSVPKECNNCKKALPQIAAFCDICGSKQALGSLKQCVTVGCPQSLSPDQIYCPKCGTKQTA